MTYTVLAHLPGSTNIAVQTADGQVGYINGSLQFHPMFPGFVEAAVAKYGYVREFKPFPVTQEELPALHQRIFG